MRFRSYLYCTFKLFLFCAPDSSTLNWLEEKHVNFGNILRRIQAPLFGQFASCYVLPVFWSRKTMINHYLSMDNSHYTYMHLLPLVTEDSRECGNDAVMDYWIYRNGGQGICLCLPISLDSLQLPGHTPALFLARFLEVVYCCLLQRAKRKSDWSKDPQLLLKMRLEFMVSPFLTQCLSHYNTTVLWEGEG